MTRKALCRTLGEIPARLLFPGRLQNGGLSKSLLSSPGASQSNLCERDGDDGAWSTFDLRVRNPEQGVRVLPLTASSAS